MVNPNDALYYQREDVTEAEIQEFLLFCISVAGKTAKQIRIALNDFFSIAFSVIGSRELGDEEVPDVTFHNRIKTKYNTPFKIIKSLIENDELEFCIKTSKLGQHKKLYRSFKEIVEKDWNLKKVLIQDLERVHGIGPKTSRYFVMYTQKNVKAAILDTHILKYMRDELGIYAPRATPQGKKYLKLEKEFIEYAEKVGKDLAEIDTEIWKKYSK